jgi:hypothetical protein
MIWSQFAYTDKFEINITHFEHFSLLAFVILLLSVFEVSSFGNG